MLSEEEFYSAKSLFQKTMEFNHKLSEEYHVFIKNEFKLDRDTQEKNPVYQFQKDFFNIVINKILKVKDFKKATSFNQEESNFLKKFSGFSNI